MPTNQHKSAHQTYPHLATDFVEDVHCLGVWEYTFWTYKLGHVASVTGSDVVSNIRTHSRTTVPFGDFLPCFVLT